MTAAFSDCLHVPCGHCGAQPNEYCTNTHESSGEGIVSRENVVAVFGDECPVCSHSVAIGHPNGGLCQICGKDCAACTWPAESVQRFADFYHRDAESITSAADVEPPFWVVYHHDMGVHIDAIFHTEIDALRFAIGNGYQHVTGVMAGEIRDLP